jgi:hypothetical protein
MVAAQAKVTQALGQLTQRPGRRYRGLGLAADVEDADIELDQVWSRLLRGVRDRRVRIGLSRFARWAACTGFPPRPSTALSSNGSLRN